MRKCWVKWDAERGDWISAHSDNVSLMKFIRSASQGLYPFRQQDSVILRHFPDLLSIYLRQKHLVGKRKLLFATRTEGFLRAWFLLELKLSRVIWSFRHDLNEICATMEPDRLSRNVGMELPLYGPHNRRRAQISYESVMFTGNLLLYLRDVSAKLDFLN